MAAQLPPAPARVLELGCGPLGGFVPALLDGGYDAVGVDPRTPEGAGYQRVEFDCRAWAGCAVGTPAVRAGPYLFAELADTTEADEQAAIDAGEIQATRIKYVGNLT